ncbi:MAG: DUF3473 domain-containing protein [Gammaproteobacteria bacterium]|nr:DUF3473 domain-containing protein [Gammaproteobacteria bacterium]
MQNALTIDVEDYFQVAALAKWAPQAKWDDFELRVEQNTNKILALCAERDIKATFFVLGWIAERCPAVVRSIVEAGHELASHGYSHQLVYNQTPEVFRDETLRSKKLLEDIGGVEVLGYRAASYSITKKSLWALDIIAEAGFKYDSSIFPVRHDRYGIPDAVEVPHRLTTPAGHEIAEFPITALKLGSYKLPIAGGGYFRLFPYWFSKWGLKRVNAVQQQPFVFYLHPWEIDPEQPRLPATGLSKFRHYNNLEKCEGRLENLLAAFSFTSLHEVLILKQLVDKNP